MEIGRAGPRHKLLEKGEDIDGPKVSTATGFKEERVQPGQLGAAQFIEPGLGVTEARAKGGRVEIAGIELGEDAADKLRREAVKKFLFFIPASCTARLESRSNAGRTPLCRLPPCSGTVPRFNAPIFTHSAFVTSQFRLFTGPDSLFVRDPVNTHHVNCFFDPTIPKLR